MLLCKASKILALIRYVTSSVYILDTWPLTLLLFYVVALCGLNFNPLRYTEIFLVPPNLLKSKACKENLLIYAIMYFLLTLAPINAMIFLARLNVSAPQSRRQTFAALFLANVVTNEIYCPSIHCTASHVQRLVLSRGYSGCFMPCFALRPVLQPDLLLQLMLSVENIAIFSHYGASLKSIIRSNIVLFQLVVHLL